MALKKSISKKKAGASKKTLKKAPKSQAIHESADRRRYQRVPLQMAVKYKSVKRGTVSSDWQSMSQDFSAGGLSMICALKLRRGQLLMLNVYVPKGKKKIMLDRTMDLSMPPTSPAAILSRVAYCKSTGRDRYQLGIEFLDMDSDNRKLLRSFLLKSGLIEENSRLYL